MTPSKISELDTIWFLVASTAGRWFDWLVLQTTSRRQHPSMWRTMFAVGPAFNGTGRQRRQRMLAAGTLLIDALGHDEFLLDRILALDPRFAKFRTVLNDERVASSLRLEDIARMLDVAIGPLVDFANDRTPMKLPEIPSKLPTSSGIDLGSTTATTLDLRPVFEKGTEPLMAVLDTVSALEPDATLIIKAPFHPLPLRRLLGGRGFESCATQVSPELWEVVFKREKSDGHGTMRA